MSQSITSAQNEDKFILSINDQQHTYTNDKAGKRQAILDGLNAIETFTSGTEVYLPSNVALQLVAAVLFPDGIRTEDAYQTVCQVTEKACAFIGYTYIHTTFFVTKDFLAFATQDFLTFSTFSETFYRFRRSRRLSYVFQDFYDFLTFSKTFIRFRRLSEVSENFLKISTTF